MPEQAEDAESGGRYAHMDTRAMMGSRREFSEVAPPEVVLSEGVKSGAHCKDSGNRVVCAPQANRRSGHSTTCGTHPSGRCRHRTCGLRRGYFPDHRLPAPVALRGGFGGARCHALERPHEEDMSRRYTHDMSDANRGVRQACRPIQNRGTPDTPTENFGGFDSTQSIDQ